MPRSCSLFLIAFICLQSSGISQVSVFPYVEHFDSIPDSTIPPGWQTTTNRRPGGDFFASLSNPHSALHCLYSQNSLIPQILTSPIFDFSNRSPDKLQFFCARSSTHKSAILVEASLDGGSSFSIALSDTLRNPGSTSYILTSLALPPTLSNKNNVRIRWRVLGDSGGSTATLRIDDVTLTTLTTSDLCCSGLSSVVPWPTSADSLILKVTVKNMAVQPASNYSIDFFCDLNNNGLPESAEKFLTMPGPPLPPGDSVLLTVGHSKLRAGDYRFYGIVVNPLDEQRSNDTSSTVISIGYPRGSMLINEFMYAPYGDEPEWVEFLNCSPDTVNLRNWRISDLNTSSKSVITTASLPIPPSGYCIVTKDVAFASYHASLACPVVIASFSALNNTTPDAVVLYDQRQLTMDSVYYRPDWGGKGGQSLERIDTEEPSAERTNWGTSQDNAGSTPGKLNSIIRLDDDLSAGRCYVTRFESEKRLVPLVHIAIYNVGKQSASAFSLKLFNDTNRDSVLSNEEMITQVPSATQLARGDSTEITYTWENPPEGEALVFGVIEYAPDRRLSNNRSFTILKTNYTPHCVVVNEIMYDPLEGQNEWLELYNTGTEVVDLKDWQLRDRPTATGDANSFVLCTQRMFLHPHQYCVVAADSTIFTLFPKLSTPTAGSYTIVLNKPAGISLGNEGDDVVLKDLTGTTIDSISFSPRWHRPDVTDTKGRSLEKINPELDSNSPESWTTCVIQTGGSPGTSNSVLTTTTQTTSSLTFSPNPFSPDGDGFEDFCLIHYRLPLAIAFIHVKIFDIKGRLIRDLANSQIAVSEGQVVWDGTDQNRQRARVGPYIVLVQATSPNGGGVTSLKGVVVVATRM